MELVRETNSLVKSFGSRLADLEKKVEEIKEIRTDAGPVTSKKYRNSY